MVRDQKAITRSDLVDAVYRHLGLSRRESASMVESVLQEILEVVVRGENVKLSGFGAFLVRQKQKRVGRNPKTGEEVPIPPRRVVTFRPSPVIKERIAEGFRRRNGKVR